MNKIIVAGIPITVVRKRMKNMYMRIKADGSVMISAPSRASDQAVQAFAASQESWLEKHMKALAEKPVKAERQFLSGEIHYLWGRPYSLEVSAGAHNAVTVTADKIILRVKGRTTREEREALLNEWYRSCLAQAIPPVLARCEARMGVYASEWRIKNMKTRWGTCNVLCRRIWFNLQLAKKTPDCLEYIVVHELTHLYERSHNAVFKAYMDRFYPDWRAVRKSLNQQPG